MSAAYLEAQEFIEADNTAIERGNPENKAQRLRRELQKSNEPDLQIRRGVVVLSLIGMAALGAVTLFQTGVISHLPDPPLPDFDSDKVNSSDTAYALGVPDGTLALAGLAANLPLAAFGGENRAQSMPLIPIISAAKSTVEAVVSGYYFYQMPVVEKKWCAYCIVGAAANVGVAALTLIEAKRAWKNLFAER